MFILSRRGGLLGRLIAMRLARLGQRVGVLGADDASLRSWCPDVPVQGIPLDNPRELESQLAYSQGFILIPDGADERPIQQPLLIDEAEQAGVHRIIRISMHGADADSPSALLSYHGQMDDILAASNVPHSIVRPHLYMQDLLLFAPSIRSGHGLRIPESDPHLGFIDIRDVADACVRLVQRPLHDGEIYTLTGVRTWSLRESALAIGESIGRTVTVETWPDAEYPEALHEIGLSQARSRAVAGILGAYTGDVQPTRTVSRITGLPPRALEMFLLDHRYHFTGKQEKSVVFGEREVIQLDHALTW